MLPFALWLVWLIPILGSLLITIIGRLHQELPKTLAIVFGVITALFSISLIPDILYQTIPIHEQYLWIPISLIQPISPPSPPGLFIGVLADPLSVFMANIAIIIGLLIIFYSIGYMHQDKAQTRYYALILLFIGAMVGLVLADNFLQLFIFWEVVGVCSYALIGFWYQKASAARAGMKAFVVTRIGDISLLIGIIFLFTLTGSFDFLYLHEAVQFGQIGLQSLGLVSLLTLGGAMGKSAQVPFHVWLPDAMEGPSTVSALIHAATMVKAGIYLVSRTFVIFQNIEIWLTTAIYVGAITALLTATMALASNDLKRVFAYSTISQLGLILTGLGIGSSFGWFAGQAHVLSHALFKALLFLCAGSVLHAIGTSDITQMGGLRQKMPITFATSIIGILALSGVPPLNGFWSKDLIFAAVWHTEAYIPLMMVWLASVFTVAYSFRWLILVFLGVPRSNSLTQGVHESPKSMTVPLVILAGTVCFSGFLIPSGLLGLFLHTEHLFEFELIPILLSLSALIIGAFPVSIVYLARKPSSERIGRSQFTQGIQKILTNGYYFDALYDKIFVKGSLWLFNALFNRIEIGAIDRSHYILSPQAIQGSRSAHHYFENQGFERINTLFAQLTILSSKASQFFDDKVVDRTINSIALLGKKTSNLIRKLQTGIIENYVVAFILGIIAFIIFIIAQFWI